MNSGHRLLDAKRGTFGDLLLASLVVAVIVVALFATFSPLVSKMIASPRAQDEKSFEQQVREGLVVTPPAAGAIPEPQPLQNVFGSLLESLDDEQAPPVTANVVVAAPDALLPARFEIISTENNKIVKDQTMPGDKIKRGRYRLRIEPEQGKIKLLEFNDARITQENISLGIDYPNTTGFASTYAVDPTQLNFTNATMVVQAQGRSLFKCVDWNFTTQSCPSGRWKKVRNLKPGENYQLTLTPDDPGFGESNQTIDVLDNNNFLINNTQTILANNSNILDVNISITDLVVEVKAKTITVRGHNDTSDKKEVIIIKDQNLTNETRLKDALVFEAINLSFSNYSATINTTGTKAFECTDWNETTGTCAGGWKKLKDHSKGLPFEHVITEARKAIAESNYSIAILDKNLNLLSYNETIFNRSGDVADAQYELRGLKIKRIKVFKRNESVAKDEFVLQQDKNLSELPGFYDRTVQLDPNITFDRAEVLITATAKYLYKCLNWNITTESCQGGWRRLQRLTPGNDYTLNLTPGDPVFLESNRTLTVVDPAGNEITPANTTILSDANATADVQFEFGNIVIKSMFVNDFNYSQNNGTIVIANSTNETGVGTSFALDPANASFANATLTIVPESEALFKCLDWNFTSQACNGDWLWVGNLTIGQDYNITINATDPGFGVGRLENFKNMSAVMLGNSGLVDVGALLNYTIEINNTGLSAVQNVVVNHTLPEDVVLSSSQPSPDPGTNVTFSLGTIPKGKSVMVNISVFAINVSNGTVLNITTQVGFTNATNGTANRFSNMDARVHNPYLTAEELWPMAVGNKWLFESNNQDSLLFEVFACNRTYDKPCFRLKKTIIAGFNLTAFNDLIYRNGKLLKMTGQVIGSRAGEVNYSLSPYALVIGAAPGTKITSYQGTVEYNNTLNVTIIAKEPVNITVLGNLTEAFPFELSTFRNSPDGTRLATANYTVFYVKNKGPMRIDNMLGMNHTIKQYVVQ